MSLFVFQVNSIANEYFIELSPGLSYGDVSSESVFSDLDYQVFSSYTVNVKTFDARFGYSFYVGNDLYLEPSLGLGYMSSLLDVKIEPLYSLEVPVMYKIGAFKLGVYAKYNYFPAISTEAVYTAVEFQNKYSMSYGAKILLIGEVVDFLVKYEYMTNAIYQENFIYTDPIGNSANIDTKLNLEGGYISAGLRFKF